MTRTFIFTAANREAQQHRGRTIDVTVSIGTIRQYDPEAADLLEAAGRTEVRCWGAKPGRSNLRSWDRMEPGDRGVIYDGGGHFSLALPVILKRRAPALAEHLWTRDLADGQT